MEKQEKALASFKSDYNCCQSVISAFIEEFDLDEKTTFRLATGFGGGMGKGDVCGAVTGAYMALGLKYGYASKEEFAGKAKTKQIVQEFDKLFIAKHGSLKCNKLLDCDISTPEGRELASQKNLFDKECPKFVRDAVVIAEGLITR